MNMLLFKNMGCSKTKTWIHVFGYFIFLACHFHNQILF